MSGGRTRGQPAAAAALAGMVAGGLPHAVLLTGPAGVGKTTLALDLAATLLCTAVEVDRPCGSCRACRLVRDGNHPDVHRLAPEGPGGQIRIDQARGLSSALALHSVEGGRRIALVEHADRMNEDAQNALLKTLEEPPSGVTLVLCADDEDRLLPTIRSRTARVRLGTVSVRDTEALLGELGLAEPPDAGRIARAAGGRPGRAVAYARAPEAVAVRVEAARTLVDLLGEMPARRLELGRDLLARAAVAVAALDAAVARPSAAPAASGGRARRRRGALPTTPDATPASPPAAEAARADTAASGTAEGGDAPEPTEAGARTPASERRRALAWLIELWADVSRDLVSVALGEPRRVRDPDLLDDLAPVAAEIPLASVAAFLERLTGTSRRLEANVSPELALDVLVLAWPTARRAA